MKKVLIAILVILAGFFFNDLIRAVPVSQSGVPGITKQLQPTTSYFKVINIIQRNYSSTVDSSKLTYAAIRGMLLALNDQFTRFMAPDEFKAMQEDTRGDFFGIGAQLQENNGDITVYEVIEDSPALKGGLKAKDIIVKVDNHLLHNEGIDAAVKRIRGPLGTKVTLTVRRPKDNNKIIVLPIVRGLIVSPVAKGYMEDPANGIGRVTLTQFNDKSDEVMMRKIKELEGKGLKALILDLRGNPGGLLNVAQDITSRFLDKGNVVIIQERGGRRQVLTVIPNRAIAPYPMVVLVNDMSASASEICSGALKDYGRAKLIGEQTFGKGLVQSIYPLDNNSAAAITTARYLTPNGHDINRKLNKDGKVILRGGIEPDIIVKQSDDWEDYNDRDHDAQLKKAILVLRDELKENKSK